MENKLAIVCSGGGMTCSYTAGFLKALVEEHNLTEPDILIAGSGSAGTAAYYVARQYNSVTDIWANRLSTKKFINKLRLRRIIDIDYLVDEVFKNQEPLDVKAILDSNIEFIIPATNVNTGNIKYFTKGHADIFEVLRATKALPILYNKEVTIQGSTYCDSRISSSAELDIEKAVELNATHILVISNDKSGDSDNFIYSLWLKTQNRKFQKNYFNLERLCQSQAKYPNTNILHFSSRRKIPASLLDGNQKHLRQSIELGYENCKTSKRVADFLTDYRG